MIIIITKFININFKFNDIKNNIIINNTLIYVIIYLLSLRLLIINITFTFSFTIWITIRITMNEWLLIFIL